MKFFLHVHSEAALHFQPRNFTAQNNFTKLIFNCIGINLNLESRDLLLKFKKNKKYFLLKMDRYVHTNKGDTRLL